MFTLFFNLSIQISIFFHTEKECVNSGNAFTNLSPNAYKHVQAEHKNPHSATNGAVCQDTYEHHREMIHNSHSCCSCPNLLGTCSCQKTWSYWVDILSKVFVVTVNVKRFYEVSA